MTAKTTTKIETKDVTLEAGTTGEIVKTSGLMMLMALAGGRRVWLKQGQWTVERKVA